MSGNSLTDAQANGNIHTVCRKQMAFFYVMELTNQNSNYEKEHDYCAHSSRRYHTPAL
jgi:hypothetical protein